jgi:protein TonB
MTAAEAYRRRLLICGAALLINTLLFSVLPHFMVAQKTPAMAAHISGQFRMVDVLRFSERKPSSLSKHPKDEVRPPEKQHAIAPQHFKMPLQEIKPAAPDINLERPSFDINPRLAAGLTLSFPDSNQSQAPPADFKTAYDQAHVDQAPMTVVKTRPVYPYRARRLHLSGEVRVKFLVDTGGQVRDIQIIQADPPDVFDNSVISALSGWRFAPGRLQGRPVATWVTTTIVFRLEDAG